MKLKYLNIVALFCVTLLLSCDDGFEEYDGLYISTTLGNNPMVSLVIDENFPKDYDITVASTKRVEEDVTVELAVDPNIIEAYNKKHGTIYQPLPKNCYTLSPSTITLKKGEYANTIPARLSVISTEGMLDGIKYMVAVAIKSTSGNHTVIEASRAVYVAINQIIVGPALRLVGSQYTTTNFTKPGAGVVLPYNVSALTKVTMEARVYIESIDAASGLNTIFGLEENFVVRISREGSDKGQLVVTGGGIKNVLSADPFPLNAWTHLAVLHDGDASGKGKVTIYINGALSASMDVVRTTRKTISLHDQYMQEMDHGQGGGAKDISDAPFWIGKSERARYLHGSVSEARIWARALSQAEIAANMCVVDPMSDRLIAYWRFNEGGSDGKTFKDLTGHGFDMKLSLGTTYWTQGVRCPE